MTFLKAITLALGEIEEPVVTPYRLGLLIHRLYQAKQYQGEKLERLQKPQATNTEFSKTLRDLEDSGILRPLSVATAMAFVVLGRGDAEPEDIACSIDPFCYISHLSAMAYHGLTDRVPAKVFLSSPEPKSWTGFAEERMRKDLGDTYPDYRQNGLPLLRRPVLRKIAKHEIHLFSSLHTGAFKHVQSRTLRVSTLGRTFLDMLTNPELCGGLRHVLQVFEENARPYLRPLVEEINRHGGQIDKVRAGYILEERLKIHDDTVNSWMQFAKRGGSRKLDPSAEYAPVWSEKWCLSLNV